MKLKSLMKITISLAMLALVLSFVDVRALSQTLLTIPVWVTVVTVCGYLLGQAVSALKWQRIAQSGGIETNTSAALKAYFIGMYVNCFGLGIVGGDVTRGLLLAGKQPKKTEAITSVFVDRVHGLCILSLLATVATLAFGQQTLDPKFFYTLIFLGASIITAWIIGPKLLLMLVSKDSSLRVKAEQIVRFFSKDSSVLLIISLLSLSFHISQIALHGIIACGLGANIPWQYLFIVIPFINIASSLPLSWNGLGVREYAFIFFFCGTSGYLTEEQAVAMGAIWLLAVTATSAFGGVIAFMTKDLPILKSA